MLKRPFVCVAIAFILGILAFVYEINILVLSVTALALTVIVYFRAEKRRYLFFTLIAVFLIGILGMKTADYRKEAVVRRFEGREITINATVTEFSSDGKVIASFREDGRNYKIYLAVDKKGEFYPGDIIKAVVKPKRPYTSKVGVSDFSTYLAGKRVYLYGFANEAEIVGRKKDGLMGAVYSVRRYVDKAGKTAFSGDNRALFNAMILGDKRFMTSELSALLRASGLNHIAVVSGMHLSIMITVMMFLLGSIIGKGRKAKIILSICAVAVTLVTGAGLSAIRATVMCIVCQGAFLTYRENDSLSGLFVTVFVMLLVNPFVIFDVGFILSVLSVLGILLFTNPVNELVSKIIKGKAGKAISVSIAVQLTVIPALILLFGTVSPYSVPANLSVNIFASAIVIAGMAFTVVSKIPILSEIAVYIVNLCCETVIRICKLIQKLPGAITDAEGVGTDFFIIWIFLLVIFSLKKKNFKFIPVISLCFAVALFGAYINYCDGKRKIKMDFITYGKRAMTVADCPDGKFLLFGCPDYSDATAMAEAYGRRAYTYTVITQKKDLSDVGKLISRELTGTVIACSEMFSPEEKQELESSGADVVYLKNGEIFSAEDFSVRFHVFWMDENFIPATDFEYKGKTFVSLQDFDAVSLDNLADRDYFFQCDYLLLPETVPENTESYENLSTGTVAADEKDFAINLY